MIKLGVEVVIIVRTNLSHVIYVIKQSDLEKNLMT